MGTDAALWIVLVGGAVVVIVLLALTFWQSRGAVTKVEMHNEIGKVAKDLDTKIEAQRADSLAEARSIHLRLNDVAQGVTKIEGALEANTRGQEQIAKANAKAQEQLLELLKEKK